jgi:dimethylaniline monooxygenase (N-oxide forming)
MSGDRVCIVGAGTSGLAMCRELRQRDITFDCFEKGSEVGGNWRIDNDNGAAAAYHSLCTNVSRRRMQYPSTPMPREFGDFVSQADMARYLAEYADRHGIRDHIRFGVDVVAATPVATGGWAITTRSRDGRTVTGTYSALVVANGKDAVPVTPAIPGVFRGRVLHSQAYRSAEPFAAKRVLVVGAGNSGCDIAVEVSRVAAATDITVRRGVHVLPRHLNGSPIDALNGPLMNRLPWRLMEGMFGTMVRLRRGPYSKWGWPTPDHRILSGTPTVSSTILPAVRSGAVRVRTEPVRFDGSRVHFRDGDVADYDSIVFATGYRLAFPFFDGDVAGRLDVEGNRIPLYRHIVPPKIRDLYLIGLVDPHAGHPPVVESQAAWIADALTGRLHVPSGTVDRPQRRLRSRLPDVTSDSILVDRFGYTRLLAADRRRARQGSATAVSAERRAQSADAPAAAATRPTDRR